MNIGAIGAAISGLSKGYQEGERFRSEMEEKEQAKKLRDIQIKSAGLTLGKQEREDAYERDMAEALKKANEEPVQQPSSAAPAKTAGIVAPGPSPGEAAGAGLGVMPEAPASPAGGIATPGGAPAAAPGGAPAVQAPAAGGAGMGSIARMGRIIDAQHQVMIKHGKFDVKQGMDLMRNYSRLQEEGVIKGLASFMTNPTEEGRQQAINIINSTGKTPIDPNSQFQKVERDVRGGIKVDDVVVTTPSGAKFSLYDARMNALDPDKALKISNDLGYQVMDLALKKTAEENLDKYRSGMLNIRNLEFNELVRHHKKVEEETYARLKLIAEQRKDLDGARAIETRQRASNEAFKSILAAYGVSKETTAEGLEKLSKDQQEIGRAHV